MGRLEIKAQRKKLLFPVSVMALLMFIFLLISAALRLIQKTVTDCCAINCFVIAVSRTIVATTNTVVQEPL